MTRTVLHKCITVLSILICAIVASCTGQPEPKIRIVRNPDSYALKFYIREIEGLCYAPQSIVFNGSLRLEGIHGIDTWTVVPAAPDQVEGLAGILSSERVRIASSDIELSVPKESVFLRPFHLQFVAFPCGAPAIPKRGGKLHIVSLSVDLPSLAPSEPALFNAPGIDNNEMMPPL